MKSWSTLIFAGCLLAAIFSVNSHPAGDVTTAKSTSSSGPALVPPSVHPTSYTSDVKSTPLSDLFKDSTESDEKTSTTTKTLFRRQAEDEDEDSTDESDGGDDDSDDDSDDKRRRDTTSTTTKGNKKNDSSESKSTENNKETKVPAKPTTPKSHF